MDDEGSAEEKTVVEDSMEEAEDTKVGSVDEVDDSTEDWEDEEATVTEE